MKIICAGPAQSVFFSESRGNILEIICNVFQRTFQREKFFGKNTVKFFSALKGSRGSYFFDQAGQSHFPWCCNLLWFEGAGAAAGNEGKRESLSDHGDGDTGYHFGEAVIRSRKVPG